MTELQLHVLLGLLDDAIVEMEDDDRVPSSTTKLLADAYLILHRRAARVAE